MSIKYKTLENILPWYRTSTSITKFFFIFVRTDVRKLRFYKSDNFWDGTTVITYVRT